MAARWDGRFAWARTEGVDAGERRAVERVVLNPLLGARGPRGRGGRGGAASTRWGQRVPPAGPGMAARWDGRIAWAWTGGGGCGGAPRGGAGCPQPALGSAGAEGTARARRGRVNALGTTRSTGGRAGMAARWDGRFARAWTGEGRCRCVPRGGAGCPQPAFGERGEPRGRRGRGGAASTRWGQRVPPAALATARAHASAIGGLEATACSVHTLKLRRVCAPKLVVSAQSAASRP